MIALLLSTAAGLNSLQAQLPMAEDAPERGYFALLAQKKLKFSINTAGEIQAQPLDPDGAAKGQPLNILTTIVETPAGGTDLARSFITGSLATDDPPDARLSKTRFRGKADNDAVMEVRVEASNRVIFLGGQVLDKGKSVNPQHVRFSIPMHGAYGADKARIAEIKNPDDKAEEEKEFVKKIRNDVLSLKLANGKRLKYKMQEPIEPLNEQIKGASIESVELEFAAYPDHKLLFTASSNSEIALDAAKGSPLNMALTIHWKSNPEKDPEGKARLALQVK